MTTTWKLQRFVCGLSLVAAGLLGFLTSPAQSYAQTKSKASAETTRAANAYEQEVKEKLAAIAKAHKEGKSTEHLRATASLLAFLNQASLSALLTVGDYVSAVVDKQGIEPYLSVSMDLAYRFGRVNHKESVGRFRRISGASLKHLDRIKPGTESLLYTLVREEGARRYRVYDARSAQAGARLLFTEFGRSQLLAGQMPSDLMRAAAMLWECRPNEENDRMRGSKSTQNCRAFTGAVANALESSKQGGQLPAALGDIGVGVRTTKFNCFSGDQTAQQMIGQMESYLACMANQASVGANPFPLGASMAQAYVGEVPVMEGWKHVQSTERRFSGPGRTGTQVDHEYTNAEGGKATVSTYAVEDNGKESSGTIITKDDGKGNKSQELQDPQGNTVFQHNEYKDGTQETKQKDANGREVEVKTKDGKTELKVTESDGTVKTATIDENGNCTGDACNTSLPSGEWAVSPCSPIGGIPGQKDLTKVDQLAPYIYPSPDSGGGSNPTLACIATTLGGATSQKNCPPAVALCVEPPPPGSCGCGKPPAREAMPAFASTCAKMQCGDGGSCNPSTGTCSSGGAEGGAFSPGGMPPLPRGPFQPKLPAVPTR